jgi:mycofactocin precursor peptide MftA
VTRSTIVVETVGEAIHMDRETETDTELVTETLVEEVSIDGMCGVY